MPDVRQRAAANAALILCRHEPVAIKQRHHVDSVERHAVLEVALEPCGYERVVAGRSAAALADFGAGELEVVIATVEQVRQPAGAEPVLDDRLAEPPRADQRDVAAEQGC